MADTIAAAFVLAQVVLPVNRSRTYTSPLEVPGTAGTKFVAKLKNATYRPSGVMTGVAITVNVLLVPEERSAFTLTSSFVPATRSRTKTSARLLVSPRTRFDARLMKAT